MSLRLSGRSKSGDRSDPITAAALRPEPRRPALMGLAHQAAARWRKLARVSAALLWLGAASVVGPTGENEEPTAWGDEALRYFQALSRAYAADDVYGVLDFYAPGAYVNMSRGDFTGGLVEDMIRRGPILDQALFDVHLGDDSALTVVEWPQSRKQGAVEAVLVDRSIISETVFDGALSLSRALRVTPEVLAFYEQLYREYAEAWSSGDARRVTALYGPDATLSEPIFGTYRAGSDAIADLVDTSKRWTPLSIAAIAGERTEAEHGSALYLGPTMYGQDPELAVGLYEVSDRGCSTQVAVRWALTNGVISNEHRYPEVESLRRCAIEELPDGWWTDLDLPGPRDEVVTGTIQSAGHEIVVHNGTERLVRVVEWALGRFEAAGLAEPRVTSVTFEPSRQCAGHSGRLVQEDGSRDLFLCLLERDLCHGQEVCDTPALNARVGILHELGHAWMLDHTGGRSQSQLLELTGTSTWDDQETPWQLRGSEYGAEVLAWGLLDELVPMVRIGDPPCSELVEVFALLTSAEPLVDLRACSG